MTFSRKTASFLAVMTLAIGMPAAAQVTHENSVKTSTSVDNGVATRTTKVVHIKKVKTRHPKRILGVKVGHKTREVKTVRTTTTSSNGEHSSSLKVSN